MPLLILIVMRAVGKGLEGIDFCNCIVVKIKAVMLLLIGAVSEHKIEGRVFRVIFHYVNCRSESFCLLRLSPFRFHTNRPIRLP